MRIMVALANGFEEIETFTVIDVLRRAGIAVDTVGVVGSVIQGMHNTRVMVDKRFSEVNVENYDGIVIPGGSPGYTNLSRSSGLMEMLRKFDAQGKMIGAICMGPSVLAKAGVLEGHKATIYPGAERELPYPRGDRLVIDSNIITSQAPGTAMEFSLALVEQLAGQKMVERLRKDLLIG